MAARTDEIGLVALSFIYGQSLSTASHLNEINVVSLTSKPAKHQIRVMKDLQFLSDFRKGQCGHVVALEGPALVIARLQELGVVRDARVKLVEIMTFGDPLVIDVNEVRMALRKSEAQCVRLSSSAGKLGRRDPQGILRHGD